MNKLVPGAPVVWNDKSWVLLDIPSIDRVLLRDPDTGGVELAQASELKTMAPPQSRSHGLMAVPDKAWDKAYERFVALRPLLGRDSRKRTRKEVTNAAKALEVDPSTVYRWISKYEESQTVSSLLKKGRSDNGGSRLPQAVETVIEELIEKFYFKKERPTVHALWEKVDQECAQRGLARPNLSTIRRRVNRRQDREVMTKRFSAKQAREKFEPHRGSFPGADVPLAVYQIDHTPIDVIFVDEEHRRPINRGYLTIVVDSCTRVLAGFCVSLDPPGALSTGLALSHAILPKEKWLAKQGVGAKWPVYGVPAKIFADNAAEFRGEMLGRACKEYGILMENRPKGQPQYGGHVERLFRTFMKRVQALPGSTFSNVQARGEYDSAGRAIMTIAEFEQWFTVFVTMVYHQRRHRGIGYVPPIKLYEQFILGTSTTKGIGLAEPVRDPYKLELDFMPFETRTIQEYGVVIDYVHYYADILQTWIHARNPENAKLKRAFLFARDPRAIGKIYFLDPEENTYYPIPYRDLSRPNISIWELRAAIKHVSEQPHLQPDENVIFEGLREMQRIEAEAAEKSLSARRRSQRRVGWRAAAEIPRAQQGVTAALPTAPANVPQMDIKPFDDIEEAE